MSCNSCSNITLPVGATGPSGLNGDDGTPGADGLFGGFSLEFEFDSDPNSTPPAGEIRFNNATPGSVTEIYISTTGTGGVDATAFLDSFNDNGDADNYGLIRIFKEDNSTVFWMGKVKNVQTSGASRTITVQYISSGGTFADTNDTIVSFVANGTNGASGATKSGVLDNYSILDDGANYGGTSPILVRTFSIPENTFQVDTDEVTIKGGFSGDLDQESTDGIYYFKVEVGGVDVGTNETMISFLAFPGKQFEMKLYRISATELRPVILSEQLYGYQIPSTTFIPGAINDDISTSDTLAVNLIPIDDLAGSYANRSFEAITPSSFASSMDVKIYMWSSTAGTRLDPVKFRLMNLHAAFNKV